MRTPLVLAVLAALVACKGPPGADGTSCTVSQNAAGDAVISCEDGTVVTVPDGHDGVSCTLTGNVITCDDGTSHTIPDGQDGEDGEDGLDAGQTAGLVVDLDLSAPANGTHFVAGESIVVTATITDASGDPLTLADLSTAGLYMSGPNRTTAERTPLALLRATGDRAAPVHHFINLKSYSGPGLSVTGHVVAYTLAPITTEAAGTYTVGLRAASPAGRFDRVFELADVQIGSATVDADRVGGGCDSCHLGTENGQTYMHHVDPGQSPDGSPELDAAPIASCRMCHNNDGYAAVRECDDGSKPVRVGSDYRCDDGTTSWSWLSDHIVRRVHGLHSGMLQSAFSLADFGDYLDVHFPADVRNCDTCHQDDGWRTKPSRLACGTCHDTVDWSTGENHGDGGIHADDSACHLCHTPGPTGVRPIPANHAPDVQNPEFQLTMTLSTPANGTHFVAGEEPVLNIEIRTFDEETLIDATTVTQADYDRARLYVSGPRSHTVPVLTTAARSGVGGSQVYADIRRRTNPDLDDLAATWTSEGIAYDLGSVTGLPPGTYTAVLLFRDDATAVPTVGKVNFEIGTPTPEPFAATNCEDCHGDTRVRAHAGAYPFDVDVCKSCHDYAQTSATAGTSWASGQYGFGVQPLPRRIHRVHFGKYLQDGLDSDFETFIFPMDVRNCSKCHGVDDRWHEAPTRLACTSCHDGAATWAHARLNTWDPTPANPWSGDEVESCTACHGANRTASVRESHRIADPYVPPYPR